MDEYSLLYIAHTEEAILLDDCGREIWLPLPQINHKEDLNMCDRDTWILLGISDWLAEEKELV